MHDTLTPPDFRNPAISLSGTVGDEMYREFREHLTAAPKSGLVVVELSTLAGDPEIARMMGEDVRYRSEAEPERRFVFLGKAAIYSAGTTFMSFFALRNRYLTRGTRLMIHERKLNKTLRIDGPLTSFNALPTTGTSKRRRRWIWSSSAEFFNFRLKPPTCRYFGNILEQGGPVPDQKESAGCVIKDIDAGNQLYWRRESGHRGSSA